MRRTLAAALVTVTSLAGCTLLVGTSGLTGGGSGSNDGATEAEASPPLDAPFADSRGDEANDGSGETTPPAEAGPDGGAEAAPMDAAVWDSPFTHTWCSQQPPFFYCADFDEGSATGGWSQVDMSTTQGTLGLSPQYVSAPNSLLSSAPAHATGSIEARVDESFPVLPSKIHVEFDMYTCGASTPGYFELAKIHMYQPSNGWSGGIDLGTSAGNDYVLVDVYGDDGGETTQNFKPSPGITKDKWVHVALDTVLDPANGSVTLVLDHASTPSVSQTGLRTVWPGANHGELVLGLYSGGANSPACEVDYDNVFVTIQ